MVIFFQKRMKKALFKLIISILTANNVLHKSLLNLFILDVHVVVKSCWFFYARARICLSILRCCTTVNRFSQVSFTSHILPNKIFPSVENVFFNIF